eukprot:1374588-Pyramimonas_sp.AAC.1
MDATLMVTAMGQTRPPRDATEIFPGARCALGPSMAASLAPSIHAGGIGANRGASFLSLSSGPYFSSPT